MRSVNFVDIVFCEVLHLWWNSLYFIICFFLFWKFKINLRIRFKLIINIFFSSAISNNLSKLKHSFDNFVVLFESFLRKNYIHLEIRKTVQIWLSFSIHFHCQSFRHQVADKGVFTFKAEYMSMIIHRLWVKLCFIPVRKLPRDS